MYLIHIITNKRKNFICKSIIYSSGRSYLTDEGEKKNFFIFEHVVFFFLTITHVYNRYYRTESRRFEKWTPNNGISLRFLRKKKVVDSIVIIVIIYVSTSENKEHYNLTSSNRAFSFFSLEKLSEKKVSYKIKRKKKKGKDFFWKKFNFFFHDHLFSIFTLVAFLHWWIRLKRFGFVVLTIFLYSSKLFFLLREKLQILEEKKTKEVKKLEVEPLLFSFIKY